MLQPIRALAAEVGNTDAAWPSDSGGSNFHGLPPIPVVGWAAIAFIDTWIAQLT